MGLYSYVITPDPYIAPSGDSVSVPSKPTCPQGEVYIDGVGCVPEGTSGTLSPTTPLGGGGDECNRCGGGSPMATQTDVSPVRTDTSGGGGQTQISPLPNLWDPYGITETCYDCTAPAVAPDSALVPKATSMAPTDYMQAGTATNTLQTWLMSEAFGGIPWWVVIAVVILALIVRGNK